MMRKRFHDLGKRFPSALHTDFLFLLGQMYFRFTHDFAQKEKTDEFPVFVKLVDLKKAGRRLYHISGLFYDLPYHTFVRGLSFFQSASSGAFARIRHMALPTDI